MLTIECALAALAVVGAGRKMGVGCFCRELK